jgi:hypothetical protein
MPGSYLSYENSGRAPESTCIAIFASSRNWYNLTVLLARRVREAGAAQQCWKEGKSET